MDELVLVDDEGGVELGDFNHFVAFGHGLHRLSNLYFIINFLLLGRLHHCLLLRQLTLQRFFINDVRQTVLIH
jgi:hypothetical protein